MKHIYRQVTACRVCGYKIELVWDLGLQFIYSLSENNAAPLRLGVCSKCELVQLMDTVDPDVLYKGDYYYKSGVNRTMREALKDVVDSARRYTKLKDGDLVLDIGANDGTLLNNYPKKNLLRVGFEPSWMHMTHQYTQIPGYFTAQEYCQVFKDAKAKIVTACAMFYDVSHPLEFLQDVAEIMHDEGVFIIQMNYLRSMVDNCNFDSISHEHLCYYSIRDMVRLTKEAGLYIEDAELNEVNGGSIRLYIRKMTDKPIGQSDRLRQLIEKEWAWYEESFDQGDKGIRARLVEMQTRASHIAEDLSNLVKDKRACAVGASTRGYVILQYAGLELPLIDKNRDKVGRSLGNMPILSEEHIDDYEIGIVLPYHFMDEMRERYKDKKIKLISAIRPV